MTACDELRPTAATMAALPQGDPEREAFLAHARSCEGCLRAFREGEKLMALIARSPLPGPSAEALRRASAPILRELQAPRWGLKAAAAVAAFAVPVLFARHREWEGWSAALVVLAMATALSAASGLWRAGAWVALAASAGFAFAAGGVPGFPRADGGFAPHIGLDCFALEVLGGALTAAAAWWIARRQVQSLGATAAAGALASQAALHIACSAHQQAPHLWLFHVGGVAAAAIAAWGVQQRLYVSRARS